TSSPAACSLEPRAPRKHAHAFPDRGDLRTRSLERPLVCLKVRIQLVEVAQTVIARPGAQHQAFLGFRPRDRLRIATGFSGVQFGAGFVDEGSQSAFEHPNRTIKRPNAR